MNSTFEEGDFNGDGDFTTADLVFVFQAGTFVNTSLAAAVGRDEGTAAIDNENFDPYLEKETPEQFGDHVGMLNELQLDRIRKLSLS